MEQILNANIADLQCIVHNKVSRYIKSKSKSRLDSRLKSRFWISFNLRKKIKILWLLWVCAFISAKIDNSIPAIYLLRRRNSVMFM